MLNYFIMDLPRLVGDFQCNYKDLALVYLVMSYLFQLFVSYSFSMGVICSSIMFQNQNIHKNMLILVILKFLSPPYRWIINQVLTN